MRMNCRIRSSSDIARLDLHDVAAEPQRDRPVADDPQLPREQRQLVQVVAARHEPAREPAQPQPEYVGDALVPPERCHLPEHAVAIRARTPPEIARQPPSLPE